MVIFLGIVCFFLIVVGIVVNSTERPAAALEVESPPAETSGPATGAEGGGAWPALT